MRIKDFLSSVVFAAEGAGSVSSSPEPAATTQPEAADAIVAEGAISTPDVAETAPAASVEGNSDTPAEPAQADPTADQPTNSPEPSLLEAAETGEKKEGEGDATTSQPDPDKAAAEKQEATEAKAEGEKKTEGAPEQPQPRSYEAFKIPEGAKLDDARTKEFTSILDDGELSHQDRAQKLLDMHVAEMERVSKDLAQKQRDAWKEYQDRQKESFRTDPELGGNRAETTLGLAKSVIETYGGTPEQVAETLQMLSYTGAGNNPGLIRVLNNVALLLSEGEPVTGNPPKPSTGQSRAQRWYNGASS